MKEVKFVRVESELSGYGLGKGLRYSFKDVENIIKEYIQLGWDYKGYIPIETRGTGDIEVMSLIFQKDAKFYHKSKREFVNMMNSLSI